MKYTNRDEIFLCSNWSVHDLVSMLAAVPPALSYHLITTPQQNGTHALAPLLPPGVSLSLTTILPRWSHNRQ